MLQQTALQNAFSGAYDIVINANSGTAQSTKGMIEDNIKRHLSGQFSHMQSYADFNDLKHYTDQWLERNGHDPKKVLLVASGDGTFLSLAKKFAGAKARIGFIPAGTFNHVATITGSPSRYKTSIQGFKHALRKDLPIAQIAGHEFFCIASLDYVTAAFLAVREAVRYKSTAYLGANKSGINWGNALKQYSLSIDQKLFDGRMLLITNGRLASSQEVRRDITGGKLWRSLLPSVRIRGEDNINYYNVMPTGIARAALIQAKMSTCMNWQQHLDAQVKSPQTVTIRSTLKGEQSLPLTVDGEYKGLIKTPFTAGPTGETIPMMVPGPALVGLD